MPRRPKLRFTHIQSGGREIFFATKDRRKNYPNEMIGFGPTAGLWKGSIGKLYSKTKWGSWSTTKPLNLRIKRK